MLRVWEVRDQQLNQVIRKHRISNYVIAFIIWLASGSVLMSYTHANKKKATQIHGLCWKEIQTWTCYDYKFIYCKSHLVWPPPLWAFCTCLKEAWGCTPPPFGMRCHCSTSWCSNTGNVAAGKGYDHVPTWLQYPRDGRSIGIPVATDMTSLQTVPCHIASMVALSCWKRKLFPTVR